MRWVEDVEAVVALVVGRAAWAAPRLLVPAALACALIPTAGTASRTRRVCLATRKKSEMRNADDP